MHERSLVSVKVEPQLLVQAQHFLYFIYVIKIYVR